MEANRKAVKESLLFRPDQVLFKGLPRIISICFFPPFTWPLPSCRIFHLSPAQPCCLPFAAHLSSSPVIGSGDSTKKPLSITPRNVGFLGSTPKNAPHSLLTLLFTVAQSTVIALRSSGLTTSLTFHRFRRVANSRSSRASTTPDDSLHHQSHKETNKRGLSPNSVDFETTNPLPLSQRQIFISVFPLTATNSWTQERTWTSYLQHSIRHKNVLFFWYYGWARPRQMSLNDRKILLVLSSHGYLSVYWRHPTPFR